MGASFCSSSSGTSGAASSIWLAMLKVSESDALDDWLKYSTDPEVVALLEAENSYTRSLFTHLTDLQKKLYNEIAGRTPETDYSVPVLRGSADRHLGLAAPLTPHDNPVAMTCGVSRSWFVVVGQALQPASP